jgi:hypothetical protein
MVRIEPAQFQENLARFFFLPGRGKTPRQTFPYLVGIRMEGERGPVMSGAPLQVLFSLPGTVVIAEKGLGLEVRGSQGDDFFIYQDRGRGSVQIAEAAGQEEELVHVQALMVGCFQ